MELNESQKKAVQHYQGPMLVLAGPGSGKTAVITRRTQYLITHYGVNPEKILIITFTKAAAREMKERFYKENPDIQAQLSFGTFHSIFFMILKYAYGYTASNIIREEKKLEFFRNLISNLALELDDEMDFIREIIGEISRVKGNQLDLEHYYSFHCSSDLFKQIYHQYEDYLRSSHLLDFDDMLVLCYELLSSRPDILKFWQTRYQHILIDEFQDICKLQYRIIQLLSAPLYNLFIVGDDDQSIYRFRGADPDIMLHFTEDYPNAQTVILDMNYRSVSSITKAALRLISYNKKRFHKNIHAYHSENIPIQIKEWDNSGEENKAVLLDIQNYLKKGIQLDEIAILFRTNTQPRSLCEKLMEFNIPFRTKESFPNLYDHWITKNVLSYINLSLGFRDRSTFLQIMNRPNRYLSRDCLTNPQIDFNAIKAFYQEKRFMVERIERLEYDLTMIASMNPFAAITYIRKAIGYDTYLKEYAAYRNIKEEELFELLEELRENAKEFSNYPDWFLHMEKFREELKLQAKKQFSSTNCITLSTMHASKGLEYRVVIIIDANEGITPYHKAMLEEDIEEERRMFYVAMTRAKKYLHIYSVKERYHKPALVSRFVGETLLDVKELYTGVRIIHKTYGTGVIRQISGEKIKVFFDRIGKERLLDLNFCISNQLLQIAVS